MSDHPKRAPIAAIASGAGAAGVGIVRVSGAGTLKIAQTLLGKLPKHRFAHYAQFHEADGSAIDRGLLLYFQGPNSFTGEDVLELHAHGSPIVLGILLRRCLALGASAARAGEFSERAYLNGKLDLTQAEAIADLISAQSERAARAALRSLDGEFSKRVRAVLFELTALRTYIEALIDFPDEEIDFSHTREIDARSQRLQKQLATLLFETRQGQRLTDGLYVVIAGPPNAGKSSLMNSLAGSDRAIVTPVPGTTRDVLREALLIDGVPVTLVDTAGLRDSPDVIEAEGIRRAKVEFERADLALLLIGVDQAPDFDALAQSIPAGIPLLKIRSKVDLPCSTPVSVDLEISCSTEIGLTALKSRILANTELSDGSGGSFSARSRHTDALVRVQQQVKLAMEQRELGLELSAEELRLAQRALSEITGDFSTEDLLGQIFSTFCIGK